MEQDLQGIHERIREEINIASRLYLRPLHILDMPEEILAGIFEYAKGYWHDEFLGRDRGTGAKEVKNLRLTYKRFCSASFHLLIHTLSIDMTAESTLHLEEVFRHSSISKGVHALEVSLEFYDSVMSNDF